MHTETPTETNPNQIRGTLEESGDRTIVLALLGSEYQLHLEVSKMLTTPQGKRITGTISAQARRIDIVRTGGRYIEPLCGRPRRVQGSIIAINPVDQTITVNAGAPIVCQVGPGQKAESFKAGDFVSFDVLAGSSFTPEA